MQILFIVLNDLSYQETILQLFIKHKVRGATILDSEGMAKAVLEYEGLGMLLGGPFAQSVAQSPASSKTIFSVIPDEKIVCDLIDDIQSALENSRQKTIGFMFTLPVSGIYPLKAKK
ncbi:MAG: hypothetical protein GX149_02595 [Acholeplasmataceae bacterium]|jgi:hypothetical protein|nr:hypothetical protein [Acholeplasmataceae bacterium]